MNGLATHLFLSITANKLEVSAEPSKSADRELGAESEDMELDVEYKRTLGAHYVTLLFLQQTKFRLTSTSMNKLLLLRPISHAIRVQRPVTCYRHLNKSFSNTNCRKFGSTSIKRTEEKNPPPPAEAAAPLILPELEAAETETEPQPEADSTEIDNIGELSSNKSLPVRRIDLLFLSRYTVP